jgi:hypothetical protein
MESQKNNGFYNRKEKRIRRRKKEILKLWMILEMIERLKHRN